MKQAIIVFIIFTFPIFLIAAFLQDYPVEETQPDGAKVKLLITGDEYYRLATDEQRYTVKLDNDGYIVYAIKERGELKPSSHRVGEVNPESLGFPKYLADDPAVIQARTDNARTSDLDRNERNNTTGSLNNLVVFLRFAEGWPFYTNRIEFVNLFNGGYSTEPSAFDFFQEESGYQLFFRSMLVQDGGGLYTAPVGIESPYPESYYWPWSPSNPTGYQSTAAAMDLWNSFLYEAISYLHYHQYFIPQANYDANSDGKLDNITFVIQGTPHPFGDLLHPRTWTLPAGHYIGSLMVETYNMVFENSSLSTICHELSHSIGFPNLYREYWETNWTGQTYLVQKDPTAGYDVMGVKGNQPVHSLVYTKYRYGGWTPALPTLISEPGYYTLQPITTNPYAAYRVNSTWPNQYYIIEYRRQGGLFESNLPGSGLIVYRINTNADGLGNDDGPPDEIYVYRPGANSEGYGGIETEAYFSQQSGRTSFHQYTDPMPFLANFDYGGLCLTEIGYAGVNITFRVRDMTPKVWKGTESSNWTDVNNWWNGIPDQNYDAEIPLMPDSYHFYPNLTAATQVKNLHIAAGAQFTISSSLIVHQDLICDGSFIISGTNIANIYGNVTWGRDATVSMSTTSARFEIRGDMTIKNGSNINSTNGGFMFNDSTTHPNSTLYVYENATINSLQSYKTYPNYLAIAGDVSDTLTINNGLFATSGYAILVDHPGIIDIKNSLSIASGAYFNGYAGTVRMSCTTNNSVTLGSSANNNFWNLEISMQNNAILSLGRATLIKNNLIISSGYLNPANYDLTIYGNWTNSIGEGHFTQGTGAVIFAGQQSSTCYGEHFNKLVNQKYETEQIIIPEGSAVRIASYDWVDQCGTLRVNGGFLMIDDLVDNGIYGFWRVDAGEAEVHQDAAGLIDLNGYLTVNGGVLRFISEAASITSNWASASGAGITMTGGTGVIDFNCSINMYQGSLGLSFSFTGGGGTVRTAGNLSVTKGGVNLSQSTFEMYGTTDAILTHGITSSSHFGNLIINKASRNSNDLNAPSKTASLSREQLRSNTATVNSALTLYGLLKINSGTFNVNGYNITANGGVEVSGNLQMAAGMISSYTGDFVWNNGSTTNITGGSIECEGNWAFNEGSTAQLDAVTTTLFSDNEERYITSCSSASRFGTLKMNEYYGSEVVYHLSPESTQPLTINSSLELGITTADNYTTLDLGSESIKIGGNVYIRPGCKLKLGPDAVFSLSASRNCTIYSRASLETIGVFNHPAYITRVLSGNYNQFNLESGSNLKAAYTIFEYMGSLGINVKAGAVVDPAFAFNYCTFRNGTSGGTLLTINNSQDLTVYSVKFPPNVWGGAYNVSKTVANGTVMFQNATGGYHGENFDNDDNNRITWGTVTSELSITGFSADYTSLYVCSPVIFSATVSNNSSNYILVPVRIDVYYNRASEPPEGTMGDVYASIPSLAPDSSHTFTFPATSSNDATSWQTWFRVDPLGEISESDETNNATGPLDITWNPLPAIQNVAITHDENYQNVIINWTYPLSVDRFKIYRGIYDNDPFTELAGTSTTTTWSEPITQPHWLYRVVAEKTWP